MTSRTALLFLMASIGSGIVGCSTTAPVNTLPKVQIKSSDELGLKTIEARFRQAADARLKAGMGFGYVAAFREEAKMGKASVGARTLEPVKILNERDVFAVGAVTEIFTAALLRMAESEGKLSLGARAEEILPELQDTEVGKVTLASLAGHQSGILFDSNVSSGAPLDQKQFLSQLMTLKVSPATAPETVRTRHESPLHYEILGLVLERVYRGRFPQILSTRVLIPLRMNESRIHHASESQKTRIKFAPAFTLSAELTTFSGSNGPTGASDGLVSSTANLQRFLETLNKPRDGKVGTALSENLTARLGWGSPATDRPALFTKSGVDVHSAFVAFDPTTDRGIFIASNSPIGLTELAAYSMGLSPRDDLYPVMLPERTVTPEEFAQLKGRYTGGQISETLTRLVIRFELGSEKWSGVLIPSVTANTWSVFTGTKNLDELLVISSGIRLTRTNPTGTRVSTDLSKLTAAELEKYPALEK